MSQMGQKPTLQVIGAFSLYLPKADIDRSDDHVSFRPRRDIVHAFQTGRSGCSFMHELPTGAAETPSFQRQRSCHRQASQSLINRRFFPALSALTPGCAALYSD
jgi:hypothetical protein